MYRCFIAVQGLDHTSLPLEFGGVEFTVFDNEQVQQFRDAISRHLVDEAEKERRLRMFEKELQEDDMYEQACAVITVKSTDYKSAKVEATRRVRLLLDIINYFSCIVPYHPNAWVGLLGDFKTARRTLPIINLEDNASLHLGHTREGSLMKLDFSRIYAEEEKNNHSFQYIDNLLTKANASKTEKRLLFALRWTGRAAIEIRPEDQFLAYFIALDAAVGVRSQSAYRLSHRVPHLLHSFLKERLELQQEVKRLYGIRSAIVHGGEKIVDLSDLEDIENMAIDVVYRLHSHNKFRELLSANELDDWFERQMLV